MKTTKRLFSLLLTLAVVLSLVTIPAKNVEAAAAPAKVKNLKCYDWYPDTATPTFVWTGTADGYKVEVFSLGKKKLKTYYTTSRYYKISVPAVKNAGCKIRVYGYNMVGGKKKFGPYAEATFVPQCWAKITKYYGAKYYAHIEWKPVKNAVGYRIYIATQKSDGSYSYKLYKKAGKQVTSMDIPRNLGYLVISPDVKVKGKTSKCVMRNYYKFYVLQDN